ILVEREDRMALLQEEPRRGEADAARRAGDEDGAQPARPGIVKPFPFRSRISCSSWLELSSTRGGRQVFHCGSLPKCAMVALSAGIIGCFCTSLRVAVIAACILSASPERQFL